MFFENYVCFALPQGLWVRSLLKSLTLKVISRRKLNDVDTFELLFITEKNDKKQHKNKKINFIFILIYKDTPTEVFSLYQKLKTIFLRGYIFNTIFKIFKI